MGPSIARQTCVFVLLGVSVASCGSEEVISEPLVRPVRYKQVSAAGGTRARTFAGVARAGLESSLSFRVAGVVVGVAVQVGDRVRAGQLIAAVDPVDYELQVNEAEAALRQTEAQSRNAAADLVRTRALYENDNASRDDLDAVRALAESAVAQVEAVEKRLELAARQVDYTRLEAPMGGAIAEVWVEVNENVSAGQPVALLTSRLDTEVEVAIPEVLIVQIQEGDSVTVAFDAIPERSFQAMVTEVGISTTAFATTFPVTVRLFGSNAEVRSGMAADVEFEFGTAGDEAERFLVPSTAVGEDREGRFVYLIESRGDGARVARRRSVTVGSFVSDELEVLDGLADGDIVISAGVSMVEDGREVRLSTFQEEQ